jgi:hypothetical protein
MATLDMVPDAGGPDAYRVLDWTNLDAVPASGELSRVSLAGSTRLAILVNSPRMLRAATVFAEQAALHGTQVRVFIDSREALAWLYKNLPQAVFDQDRWPVKPQGADKPFRSNQTR